jgi:hypothetical protein
MSKQRQRRGRLRMRCNTDSKLSTETTMLRLSVRLYTNLKRRLHVQAHRQHRDSGGLDNALGVGRNCTCLVSRTYSKHETSSVNMPGMLSLRLTSTLDTGLILYFVSGFFIHP